MLVLSRRLGEAIQIGEGREAITIEVVEIDGNRKVRLGIQAPRHVPVHRVEIANLIARQKSAERTPDEEVLGVKGGEAGGA